MHMEISTLIMLIIWVVGSIVSILVYRHSKTTDPDLLNELKTKIFGSDFDDDYLNIINDSINIAYSQHSDTEHGHICAEIESGIIVDFMRIIKQIQEAKEKGHTCIVVPDMLPSTHTRLLILKYDVKFSAIPREFIIKW